MPGTGAGKLRGLLGPIAEGAGGRRDAKDTRALQDQDQQVRTHGATTAGQPPRSWNMRRLLLAVGVSY